jgi:hypothetical protein
MQKPFWKATGKVCGVPVGEVAGTQSGSSSAERITVNTGTVSGHALSVASGGERGVERTDR